MIRNNLSPILFEFDLFGRNLDVRIYSLVYAFGILFLYFYLSRYKKKLNLEEKNVDNFIIALFFGTIIFARFFSVFFYYFDYYINNPFEIFMIWKGGLSFHGGILGFFIVSYFYSKIKDFQLMKFLNLITLPMSIFLGLGRIANFFNHEIVGTQTNVAWCVIFNGYLGCRHPAQIYEAIIWFSIAILIYFNSYFKNGKYRMIKNEFIFSTLIYLTIRFFIEFFKETQRIYFLTVGQILCIIFIILIIYLKKESNLKIFTKRAIFK